MNSKKKKKIHRIIAITLIMLVLTAIGIFLSPLFAVETFEVAPMQAYTQDDILPYISDLKGINGFMTVLDNTKISQSNSIISLRLSVLEEKIAFDKPYLKSVKVKYVFPHTISVSVEERIPALLLEHYGIYLYIDKEGYVLGTFTEADKPQSPIVKGADIGEYKIGLPLSAQKNIKIDILIKLYSLMSQLSMTNYVDIIDVTDYNNIRMFTAPSLVIEFGSGTDNISDRLTMLKGILDSDDYSGESNGVLDFTSGAPVFRKN